MVGRELTAINFRAEDTILGDVVLKVKHATAMQAEQHGAQSRRR